MKGIHIIADLYKCNFGYYISKNSVETIMIDLSKIITQNGLNIVGEKFHIFGENSFTGVFVLAESHLAIHTWPEENYISLDIFVCNYSDDNSNRAKQIFQEILEKVKSEHIKQQIIER